MDKFIKRGILLEYATLGWNVIGVALLAFIAPLTHSIALVAFGFDTLLEIIASTVVIWELSGIPGSRQKIALKILSIAFFLLGLYLSVQSIYNLLYHSLPDQSSVGIIWLVLTFAAMTLLALGKGIVGRKIGNSVLLTESRVTMVDAALAAVVLTGFILTTILGWWWTDSVAALILTLYCFWEARHAWKEAGNISSI